VDEGTWELLENQFRQFPVMRGPGGSADAPPQTEASLGVAFDPDYRDFLLRYGSAIVGAHDLYGVTPNRIMGKDWSVVDHTLRARTDRLRGSESAVVISDGGDGSPIAMTPKGAVILWDHVIGQITKIAPSFEDFLRSCLEDNR
jgi:hypothetical protein